jgi:hypothetical protein
MTTSGSGEPQLATTPTAAAAAVAPAAVKKARRLNCQPFMSFFTV